MATKLPTLPAHNSPALDKIEAAMKAARERQASLKPATPTVVIPVSKDPVQAQLDKARALAAKQEVKDARKAAALEKRAKYEAERDARKAAREAKKAETLAKRAAHKAEVEDRKSPEGKAVSKLSKILKKLSPEAFEAYEVCKDLAPEDAKALIRALYTLNTPVAVKVTPAVEAPAEVAAEADEAAAE